MDRQSTNGDATILRLADHVVHGFVVFDEDEQMSIDITAAQRAQKNQQVAFSAADSRNFYDVRDAHESLRWWALARQL